jgi:hypothetical protein
MLLCCIILGYNIMWHAWFSYCLVIMFVVQIAIHVFFGETELYLYFFRVLGFLMILAG